jgi:hypothetical protein
MYYKIIGMSNYPQDKFSAPDISGKWRYWTNNQTLTSDGVSEITEFNGIIDINQNNLFFNYVNIELNLIRLGVFVQTNTCVDRKFNTNWEAQIINNTDNGIISLYPYFYKNGKPTKMTNNNVAAGPVDPTSTSFVRTTYYEKI